MRIRSVPQSLLAVSVLLGLAGTGQAQFPSPVIPGPFGVAGQFPNYPAGELPMVKAGGFRYVRTDFKWASTETTPGVYNFAAYDTLVTNLAAQNLKPYFILDYGNGLYDEDGNVYAPATAAARTAFKNWAVAAVTYFAGRGIIWELWNEPDLNKFWKPSQNAGDYALLMNEVCPALQTAAPGETLVGPALAKFNGTLDTNFAYLETQFEQGALNYFDGVSVHAYRNSPPENVADDFRRLRRSIKVYGPAGSNIPIVSGEWGYNTSTDLTRYGISDAQQGQFLSRQWLTNLSNDIPLSIWYNWRDSGTDPAESQDNYGTVENTYYSGGNPVLIPKPSYNAAKTLTTVLNGYSFNKRIWTGGSKDYILLFTNGSGGTRLAAWTTNTPHSVTVPASAGTFNVTGNTGASGGSITATASGLSIPLMEDVKYLVPSTTNDILRIVGGWQRLPLDSMLSAPLQLSTTLSLTNPTSNNVTITPVSGSAITIAPGGTGTIPLVQAVTTGTTGGSGWVNVSLGITYGSVTSMQMAQQTYGQIPFETAAFPLAGNTLPIRVDYYGDTAWSGTLSLYGTSGITPVTNPLAVSFAAGEHRKYVNFTLTGTPASSYTFGYNLKNSAGATMVAPSAKTFQVADNFSSYPLDADPSGYDSAAAGAVGAGVTHTLRVKAPPAGLPASVSKVLKLAYTFPAGEANIRIKAMTTATQTIPGTPKAIGMWVYGDGKGLRGQMRFKDNTAQEFRVDMANQPERVNWTGWRYVTFPLDGTNASYWNGANDGVVHGPITLNTLFMVDNMDQFAVEGEVYVSGPTYLY